MSERPTVKERILDAADATMFVEGVPSTPVDVILKTARASPPSLYRHFGNKDGLLGAALRRRLEVWTQDWLDAIAAAETPEDRLLAIWPALRSYQDDHLTERWCSFTGTAAAFREPPEEAQAVIDEELTAMRERFTVLAADVVGKEDAPALAEHMITIYFGTITMMLRMPYVEAIEHGRRTAREFMRLTTAARG